MNLHSASTSLINVSGIAREISSMPSTEMPLGTVRARVAFTKKSKTKIQSYLESKSRGGHLGKRR